MTFNGPPPQEKPKPKVETPEYWKENVPFKSPRAYFELQYEFAKIMAERRGITLTEAVQEYAPIVQNTTHYHDDDWNVTGPIEDLTEENMVEKGWAMSLVRHDKSDNAPAEYHPEGSRFGCHYYTYDEDAKTIWVHFFNAEFEEEWVDGKDVSKGPLAAEKTARRKRELTDMFRDIKARYPEAKYVRGASNLYSLRSPSGTYPYRRLYPDTYRVGDVIYNPKLWRQGTTIWGQFLGGNDKVPGEYGFKKDLADAFLQRVREVPLDRLADALPNPPRSAEGDIQDFYDFYGIT